MDLTYPTDALADDIVGKVKSLTQGMNYVTYVLVASSVGYCFQVLFEGPEHAVEAAPLLLPLMIWPFVHNALDFPWRAQAINQTRDEILDLQRRAQDQAELYTLLKQASIKRRAFTARGFPVGKSMLLGWAPPLILLALIHVGA